MQKNQRPNKSELCFFSCPSLANSRGQRMTAIADDWSTDCNSETAPHAIHHRIRSEENVDGNEKKKMKSEKHINDRLNEWMNDWVAQMNEWMMNECILMKWMSVSVQLLFLLALWWCLDEKIVASPLKWGGNGANQRLCGLLVSSAFAKLELSHHHYIHQFITMWGGCECLFKGCS